MRADLIRAFIKASYEEVPPLNMEGYMLDTYISNKTGLVYFNPETQKAVVVHRGTKGATDWANNLAYMTGYYKWTGRYKSGENTQKKAEKKYGAKNVTTIGHSQGAIIARNVASKSNQVINVNPAWRGEPHLANEYVIRSDADPISKAFALKKEVNNVLFPTWSSRHNITIPTEKDTSYADEHNSDVLKRLGEQEIGGQGIRTPVAFGASLRRLNRGISVVNRGTKDTTQGIKVTTQGTKGTTQGIKDEQGTNIYVESQPQFVNPTNVGRW